MGYREIIEANRKQHKGTFMDRTWRFDPETNGEKVLNNDELTFWQKLTNGAYTYQALSARFVNNFETTQSKVSFIEKLVERKSTFSNEEDQLLVKRSELMLLRKYNYFRAFFMAVTATFCTMSLFNTRISIMKRVVPILLAAPLITFYNKNIGMY
mmetsp:Transcript_5726/g.7719  ORF Transcript_5726/g.7719 Transcript_5726/m.7719 type:complete len:155 (-) Transcript_5726:174-638(-)